MPWPTPAGLDIADNAFSNVHKTTLYVPIGCTRKYETRSPWNNFMEIKEYVPGGSEGKEKCKAPVIGIEGNRLTFRSATDGAKYYYTIECEDNTPLAGSEDGNVELSATYKVSAYAYADEHDNSETVEAILVWVNPSVKGDNVIAVEARTAVLVKRVGNTLAVSGTERGASIELYSTGGMLVSKTEASDGESLLPCVLNDGEIYLLKYGEKTFKIRY